MQNALREHSAILSTFVKIPFVFKTFVSSIFEWPLKTGFTVLIAYAQIPLINAYTDVPCGNRGLHVGLSLHRHPYFVCACSEGESESAHMRTLACAFVAGG